MQAEIITIGDEILIGQIIDSNSAWIAQELNKIGVGIFQITSVSDERSHILQLLEEAQKRSDIIIITGGLGPTKDDITKSVLCEYFDTRLVHSNETFEDIKSFLALRGIAILNEQNTDQAMIPEACTPLQNKIGTAPGMYFVKRNKHFFSIPGVPFEMKGLMTEHIIPIIKKHFSGNTIVHKVVMTQGIFEARLAKVLEGWEKTASENGVKIAYLPQPGLIRVRLSVSGYNEKELNDRISKEVETLKQLIPEYIYGYDEEMPYESVAKLLSLGNKTVSTAESCTGGYISHLLTSMPGSSTYFIGSVIAYSNEIKQNILNIPEELVINHGAVSREVVEAMANSIRLLYNTDYAIATSGIAGPDGGTDDKPVGTTWIAICSREKTLSEKFLFGENRERNIRKTAITAFAKLRSLILEERS